MTRPTEGASRSALDEAWSARVAGRTEDAIRATATMLAEDASQLPAGALLAESLVHVGRTDVVAEAAPRLVDAFIRRGDLPRALAMSIVAAKAGADAAPLRRAIALAFGAGSPRVADVPPAPPPLPTTVEASAQMTLEAAEAVLRAALSEEDPVPPDEKLPRLPLFGALAAPTLERLLAAWELREVAEGDFAIEEGAEGLHAFVVVRGHLRAQRGRGDGATTLAELGPGAVFGEMALVSAAPRAASVVAREACQLLVAHRDALEALAKKTPVLGQQLASFCRARMISNLLRHSPILRAVAPAERSALMDRFETRSFHAGDPLVRAGTETEGLFLIASGAVTVMGRDGDGDALQVAELGPGDVVGEISLVLRRPATADVVATHPTVALELRREQFQAAIKEHPGLLGELYDLATKREEEMRTVVAQETLDVEGVVLL